MVESNPVSRWHLPRALALAVILTLGLLAHRAVLRAKGLAPGRYPFSHNARRRLPQGPVLVSSYHCSRYNTQTRRLTEAMFHDVFRQVREYLDG